MLTNGLVVDSANLPQHAIQEHPVVVSADSLMASIHSDASQAQNTVLASGGGLIDSAQFMESQHHALQSVESDASTFDSSILHAHEGHQASGVAERTMNVLSPGHDQQRRSDMSAQSATSEGSLFNPSPLHSREISTELEENVQYHPIRVSGPTAATHNVEGTALNLTLPYNIYYTNFNAAFCCVASTMCDSFRLVKTN